MILYTHAQSFHHDPCARQLLDRDILFGAEDRADMSASIRRFVTKKNSRVLITELQGKRSYSQNSRKHGHEILHNVPRDLLNWQEE
jgi:hypothetical protein